MTPPVVMTVGVSDSSGASGIQADLKTLSSLRVFGATVLTAVASQNTRSTVDLLPLAANVVASQMSAVLEDMPVNAVKTGMFPSAEVASTVTHRARDGSLPNLVVDPVLSLESRSRKAITSALVRLLPYALVVTPNRDEASALLGWQVATVTDMAAAAEQLAAAGPKYVVITGGDLVVGDEAIDAVWADGSVRFMHAPRLSARNSHGSGSVFSAALTGRIALGDSVLDALAYAKSMTARAIGDSAQWKLGGGQGPVDVFGWSSPVP